MKIINVSSPFGLNSKELFLNIRYKGMIVNKVSDNLFMTDLDGHLVNVEGSPIFANKTNDLLGIRLPSVHSYNLFMGCSLMIPIQVILNNLLNVKRSNSKIETHNKFNDIIVKIKDGHLK
jgi:hypothetical protein